MREVEERTVAAYRARFAAEPVVVGSAPGRVNLLGEHTDYNGGFVLPCAIDRRTAIALGPADDATTLYSDDFAEIQPLAMERTDAWADYPSGVVWALRQAGRIVPPFRAAFAGDVPRGAGLSSSAAIEAATALALDTWLGLHISRAELAMQCQRAENDFVGVPCGVMDQFATLLCQAGQALLLDCRSLAAESVPLDLERAGLQLVVCDTQVERHQSETGYKDRRAACERAARILGVEQLRDATVADLTRLSGVELRRARHVVTENARVLAGAEALRQSDFAEFGQLMYASHASLRGDFEVSSPELDTFVQTAQDAGAVGARLTGAGFGGCAIALTARDAVEALVQSATARFAELGFSTPSWYLFAPSAGAEARI